MASTVWKGYLTFGLISVPLRLYSAARGERVSFHQIHEVCNTRIKQQLYCPTCDRTVERSEIVKGHEIDKNSYVLVDDEETKKVAPQSSDAMEILEVVKLEEIDPIYFESSYYAVPEPAGRKAYSLLVETMKGSGLAAIAKLSMHRREYTVIIRPRENGLTLHTIYYENEVRRIPEYENIEQAAVSSKEVQLAEQLLRSLEAPFDPSKYHDEYQKRLQELVDAKAKGTSVQTTPERKLAPVVDLMKALEQSLKKAPARAERPDRVERKPARKTQGGRKAMRKAS
jgi:DNA end-binding protein Ku